MKVIVVGLGVQGYKRRRIAGNDFVADVDPANAEAKYRDLQDVPLDSFDAALLCVPDQVKVELIRYLLANGKHVLVEKPLFANDTNVIDELQAMANANGVVCYTAYNHRFEPHFVKMRDLIASGTLGEIYRCRMFYGNGTARLVRDSEWRDKGAGVLPDLGSHLLDTASFWFGRPDGDFRVVSANRFENLSADHVVIGSSGNRPELEMEMTLLMWRNHFTCDVLAEKGSAHISSLCKWGPSTFTVRRRVLPSGRPLEETKTLTQSDPTWEDEYRYFCALCSNGGATDLSQDKWLLETLTRLSEDVLREA
ncbi:MAG: Gfo/Idh/MocA family oxidoreductase [Rhodospirillales bacterium]|nr:Gfo/Idh/MocA family oxidoreductase [Rhodospirillales bacterium]MBO6786007.1 Gfo/Idh/MocA family oxidoreductase [Rhodospirillales bacterium]